MTNGFIEKVAEQISDKHSRKLITAELESHLLDKIDYYIDIGYSREEAEKRATEEMGNPDYTAVPLNALHQNKYRGVFTFICLVAVTALFMATVNASPLFCYVAEYSNLTHYAMFDFLVADNSYRICADDNLQSKEKSQIGCNLHHNIARLSGFNVCNLNNIARLISSYNQIFVNLPTCGLCDYDYHHKRSDCVY